MLRIAAPHTKTYWSGRPGGLPPHSLVVPILLVLFAAHWAILLYWLNVDQRSDLALPVVAVSIPGTIAFIVGMPLIAWSRAREYWRTEYHMTSADVFVAKGAHLLRYDLPEMEPVDKRSALSLGPLDWQALAPDGRPWARGRHTLVLRGLGARKEQVRTALRTAREEKNMATEPPEVPSAPTEPPTPWWGHVIAVPVVILLAAGLLLWPFACLFWALQFAAMFLRTAWCTVVRRPARRAWTASHAPTDASAFAGVDPGVVTEVRSWLAHAHRVPANLMHPDDTLASLKKLSRNPLFRSAVTLEVLILRALPESTTVDDLVKRVDAALAAEPLEGGTDVTGSIWDCRFEVIPSTRPRKEQAVA